MGCYRFLVSTEAAELPVAVVLNKADLVPQQQCDQAVREVREILDVQLCRGSVRAVSGGHAERLLIVALGGAGEGSLRERLEPMVFPG